METIQKMNGTIWVFAAILISLVLVQSFLFLRLALRFNEKHKLVTKEELKSAQRTGMIAAIGPSFASIVVALSLIAMVGPAATFTLCGVIGAPVWELYMANIASTAAGVQIGGEGFTESIFTFCLFCMVLGSAPYFINTMLMLKPMDALLEKSKEKKQHISFMPYLSTSAMFGLLGYSVCDYFSKTASIVAAVGAGISYYVVEKISKKTNNSFLSSMGLGIAMLFGMLFGQVFTILMAK